MKTYFFCRTIFFCELSSTCCGDGYGIGGCVCGDVSGGSDGSCI